MSRRRVSVLTAALAALAAAFLAVAPPAQAADPCVSVRFVAVRGSGEAGGTAGNAANDIYTAIKGYAPKGVTTALTGIDYAAVGMDTGGIATTIGSLGWRYQSSKSGGVRNLDSYLDKQQSCGSERWVLLGFSQGAHVVGDALSSSDGTLDTTQQGKLAGVVLLADPRFNPQESFVAGTFSPARYGIAGKRPKGDLTRGAGKIKSWCDADDFVCQGVGTDDKKSVHSGTRYVADHKDAITSFLRTQLGWMPTSGTTTGYTGPIDIAFAIDTTGSMSGSISAVSKAAVDLFNQVKASGASARVGLVDYKDTDQGDPYGSRLDLPFTTDAAAFPKAVGSLVADGGGDWPEAVLSGIQASVSRLSWRNGAKKAIVVLGDAPGKDPEPVTGLTSAKVLKAAYDLDPAQIYAISLDREADPFFQMLTDGSAGQLFPVDDPSAVVPALSQALLTAVNAPVAVLSPLDPIPTGATVTLSAADSFDPLGKKLTEYFWDFDGDGTVDQTTAAPTVAHTFTVPITGTAAVTVTNEAGVSATGSTPLVVTGDRAVAPVDPPGPVTALAAKATGSQVDVTWGAADRAGAYLITVGTPGATEPSAIGVTVAPGITFTDAVPGSYVVTVWPANDAGLGPSRTTTVTVVGKGNLTVTASPVSVTASLFAHKMTFKARLTDQATGLPVAGIPVSFRTTSLLLYDLRCSATTGADGVASCWTDNGNLLLVKVPSTYSVTVAETAGYNAASGTGAITK